MEAAGWDRPASASREPGAEIPLGPPPARRVKLSRTEAPEGLWLVEAEGIEPS